MKYFKTFAAQSYGESGYGTDSYGAETTTGTVTPTEPTVNTPGGMLADTGYNILIPAAFAVSLIGASVILMVKKIRRHKK